MDPSFLQPTDRPRGSAVAVAPLLLWPLTVFVTARCLAAAQSDPGAAAESAFLGFLAAGVVAAVAALATPRVAGWTAALAVTGIWITGHGPHRGALVTMVLVGGLGVAAALRLSRDDRDPGPAFWVALAIGTQLLTRCDLLLPPFLEPRTVVSVAVLPPVSGLALWVLGRRYGRHPALFAGAAAVVLSPGLNVTVTLALMSLAAGAALVDRDLPVAVRWSAAAFLLVPPVWDPVTGSLMTIAGATPAARLRPATLPLVPAAAAGIAFLGYGGRPAEEVLALWALGLLTLPLLFLAPAGRRRQVLIGAVVAVAGALISGHPWPGAEAMAAGLGLSALGLSDLSGTLPGWKSSAPAGRSPGVRIQLVWSASLVLGTTVLATYPWLRHEPLRDTLGLAGWNRPEPALFLVMAVASLLALTWDRWLPGRRGAAWVAGTLVAAACLGSMPATLHAPVDFQSVTLRARHPRWLGKLPSQEVHTVVVDSHLVHAGGLEPGTVVGHIVLLNERRKVMKKWPLLAGFDTAEWAAARSDLAARPEFVAPSPWLSRLAPTGTFFGQRFRTRFALGKPRRVRFVALRRERALPEPVLLNIDRLELR